MLVITLHCLAEEAEDRAYVSPIFKCLVSLALRQNMTVKTYQKIALPFTLPPPPRFQGLVHRGSGVHPGNRNAPEEYSRPSVCSGRT